jgi:hypothetical protein
VCQTLDKIFRPQQERLTLEDMTVGGLRVIPYEMEGEIVSSRSASTKALNGAVNEKNEADVMQSQKG